MNNKLRSLPAPATTDHSAYEIMRVWIDGEVQKFSILTDIWDDPTAWGLLLVDLARHIAYAESQNSDQDYKEILNRIKHGFDIEWEHPTGDV